MHRLVEDGVVLNGCLAERGIPLHVFCDLLHCLAQFDIAEDVLSVIKVFEILMSSDRADTPSVLHR